MALKQILLHQINTTMKLNFFFILLPLFSFISPTEESEELIIYDFYNYDSTGFIILTDSYAYNEHPDSSVIAKKHLNNESTIENNYHKLDAKYRKKFLESVNIKETDIIYIYDLSQNSVFAFNVKDINLVAFINPYGGSKPLSQWDFMIGFELEKTELNLLSKGNDFFVCVGERNPFREGEAKSMIWKEIDSNLFPHFSTEDEELKKYLSSSKFKTRTYHCAVNKLDYFVKDTGRYRIIVIIDSNKTVVSTISFRDGESIDFSSLHIIEKDSKENYYTNQWTGNIFKNKPPILFGFESVSFGCPSVCFVDKNTPCVYIRCDNRH